MAISQPKNIIQNRLATGCSSKLIFTSFQKGNKDNPAILKHCFPKGMPMIIMHQSTPSRTHKIHDHQPTKTNQRILPNVFIFFSPILNNILEYPSSSGH